tara:strand:- start:855 stop:1118 length:264 start_codon:yes stop_codon:yes gene_type:complete
MKIRIDITELSLEGYYTEIDLSDPDDKKRYARFFDLYGNLLPDADHYDLLAALMDPDGPDRLNHAGWTEVQDRYIDGCAVVRETEAA